MRYVLGFIVVLALSVMGCSETAGTGGSGGIGGEGGTGGIAGTGGSGGFGGGGTGGTPECESAKDCDDGNECTVDACDLTSGSCENTAVPDGGPCGGETYWGDPRGECYRGLCNFVPVSVAVGAKEIAFDWSAERCEDLDIPDGPAKAVRAEDGEIVLFATHYRGNYLSRGADFDTLMRACDPPPLVSAELPTPQSYENFEWLWSPYRQGASWHVLIHNEYHPLGPLPCTATKNCWYNSLTYAVSTDNAQTFTKPSPPAHVVAPAPNAWTPPPPDSPAQDWFAEGYFAPTNIVRGPDDYYYTLFVRMDWRAPESSGACAVRTKTLEDPTSWRAWDGDGFDLALESPYVAGGDVTPCELVVPFVQLGDTASLTYNTYLDRYMWVGVHLSWETGESVCGFYFSTSFDLIHWSDIQLIARVLNWCETDSMKPGLLEVVQIQYPSIIDHADSTTNFERPGRTPYLYYTRFNGGLDRDLVRVPVTFTLEK